MDYKALVHEWRVRMRNLLDKEPFTVLAMEVRTLCDAVEALEKDRERLNVAERLLGEPTQRAQQFRDGLIALVHDGATVITLRDLIDAASSPTPTASTPTPAAPSDA